MSGVTLSKQSGKRVALGMSGGVDSSVCAALLREQGYDVTGVFMECWRAPGCRAEEDRKDALAVALQLGIPFKVLDFKDAYKQKVVEYFFAEYKAGRTPNPDVMCNKEIKFGLFYDWAMAHGFDAVATGHYAQSLLDGRLLRSTDEKKDQTYFLYLLTAEQLKHILFPIGHLEKREVRALAEKFALPVAQKPDSQGICFIGEINVHNFLRDRLGENPGVVVNVQGEVIGEHKGLWFYTIGQRHGFTLKGKIRKENNEWKHVVPPFYVIAKNVEKNQLIVGFGEETYRNEFFVRDIHWIGDEPSMFPYACMVRIRHGGKLLNAKISVLSNSLWSIILDKPVRGIADGQSAVIYQNQNCLGGGVIIMEREWCMNKVDMQANRVNFLETKGYTLTEGDVEERILEVLYKLKEQNDQTIYAYKLLGESPQRELFKANYEQAIQDNKRITALLQ